MLRRTSTLSTAVLFLVLAVVVLPTNTTAKQFSTQEKEVIALATAAFEAQDRVLVSGDIDGELARNASAADFKDAALPRMKENKRCHHAVAADRLAYTGVQTKVSVRTVDVQSTQATLDVMVHTTLGLPKPANEPNAIAATESEEQHRLTFTIKQNGKWKLVSDEFLDAPKSVAPLPEEAVIAGDASALEPQADKNHMFTYGSTDAAASTDATIAAATLDRYATVNYARTYWQNYNPSYRN